MKSENTIEFSDFPNEKYKIFFDKSSEVETLNIPDWKPVHILFFFCKKYKETYNAQYKFKFNNPSPAKCFEVFQVKRLGLLLSKQPDILKEYIEWIFQEKIIKPKKRITSISFLTKEDNLKEYKMKILLNPNSNINRSTPLQEKYAAIFKSFGLDITTYGDLAFAYKSAAYPKLPEAINEIKNIGFDINILDSIV